jgi:hypothetical protein
MTRRGRSCGGAAGVCKREGLILVTGGPSGCWFLCGQLLLLVGWQPVRCHPEAVARGAAHHNVIYGAVRAGEGKRSLISAGTSQSGHDMAVSTVLPPGTYRAGRSGRERFMVRVLSLLTDLLTADLGQPRIQLG